MPRLGERWMADHFDESARPRMVDVSAKPETERFAVARGFVRMDEATLALVLSGSAAKGDVARVAELRATRWRRSDRRPHPALPSAAADRGGGEGRPGRVSARPRRHRRGPDDRPDGVEMEALTAVSVACPHHLRHAQIGGAGMTIERIELTERAAARRATGGGVPRSRRRGARAAARRRRTGRCRDPAARGCGARRRPHHGGTPAGPDPASA